MKLAGPVSHVFMEFVYFIGHLGRVVIHIPTLVNNLCTSWPSLACCPSEHLEFHPKCITEPACVAHSQSFLSLH